MAEKKWRRQAEAVYRALDKGLIRQRTDSYHWSIPASPKARAALALILGGMLAAMAVGAVLMGWFPAGLPCLSPVLSCFVTRCRRKSGFWRWRASFCS